MPAIIAGYEYDIFISYRQKDNKYDGWVTEFVSNLKRELEATFREEISVYFDMDPADGIHETYDVDDSLRGKLRSLIFIPVISRTYCDPESFAWKNEFKTFIEEASKDRLGLKIKLRNGNIASRVLPVRIYDLSEYEVRPCENLLGGTVRGVDFIYRSPGVNRPLRAGEDHPGDNTGKLYYRDQINKLANSIKELFDALQNAPDNFSVEKNRTPEAVQYTPPKRKFHLATASLIILILVAAAIFLKLKILRPSNNLSEKSIAVLPFVNRSTDKDQDYLGDGITEEILNNLFMIGGLKIPSYTSSIRFRGVDLPAKEIARQLNVAYLLEGSVNKSNDILKINVRLVDGKTGLVRWSKEYSRDVEVNNYLEIQSDIARNVARSMNIELNSSVENRISKLPTTSLEAYELFFRAMNQQGGGTARILFEKAIELDPEYADAYAGLANYWLDLGGHAGDLTREQVIEKAGPLLSKALELDPNSVMAHYAAGRLNLYFYHDFKACEKEYETVRKLVPSNSTLISHFSDFLIASGRFKEAFDLEHDALTDNPGNIYKYIGVALSSLFIGREDITNLYIDSALSLDPKLDFLLLNAVRIYNYLGRHQDAINLYNTSADNKNEYFSIPYFSGHLGVAYAMTGNDSISGKYLEELLVKSTRTSIGSPAYFAAAIYTSMGRNDEALSMLRKAFDNNEVETYWLRVEPLFRKLHGDPRFEKLVGKL